MSAHTDRELLELAAKAAGYKFDSTNPFEIAQEHKAGMNWIEWNPLTDDGDALQLMVTLGLPVDFDHSCGAVWVHNPWTGEVFHEPGSPEFKANPCSLRRAIVRAAADIAKRQAPL